MVCWVNQICGKKFCDFFHHHLHTFMVLQLYKKAMSVSMKVSRSSREFSLKLSLAYSARKWTRVNYWHLCKLLPNLLAETLYHYCGIIFYFLKYFKVSYSWCQLSEEQKFSRENFRGLLKICENCEHFLTVKLSVK